MAATQVAGLYDARFYANQSRDSYHAARLVLPVVLDMIRPVSMIDLGCGVGTWLAAARELGVARVVGVEGSWVEPAQLRDSSIELRTRDLSRPLHDADPFDLAMSLEVAEHLPASRAEGFVDELCRFSRAVFFGAAVPGQGGVHHLNEQWQTYWVRLFEARGYVCLDIVRPAVWENRDIPIHYRQNPFLFVRQDAAAAMPASAAPGLALRPWPIDQVHPEMYLNNLRTTLAPLTIGQIGRAVTQLPSALVRSVRNRLTRRIDKEELR